MSRITYTDDYGRYAGWIDTHVHEGTWAEDQRVEVRPGGEMVAYNIDCDRVQGSLLASWMGDFQVEQAWVDRYILDGLFRTRSGQWVRVTVEEHASRGVLVKDHEAMQWLTDNAPASDLDRYFTDEPEEVRRPGQPPVGEGSEPRKVTMDAAMWAALGERAEKDGVSRGEVIRTAVSAYLA